MICSACEEGKHWDCVCKTTVQEDCDCTCDPWDICYEENDDDEDE